MWYSYNYPAPDVPIITAASSKQSQSITVEFTQVSGASSYLLRTESTNGFFMSETSVPGSPGTVSGLQPYTDYTLSVMSVNSGGKSQPSFSVQAKTGILPSLSSLEKKKSVPLSSKETAHSWTHTVSHSLSLRLLRSPDLLAELKSGIRMWLIFDLQGSSVYVCSTIFSHGSCNTYHQVVALKLPHPNLNSSCRWTLKEAKSQDYGWLSHPSHGIGWQRLLSC